MDLDSQNVEKVSILSLDAGEPKDYPSSKFLRAQAGTTPGVIRTAEATQERNWGTTRRARGNR